MDAASGPARDPRRYPFGIAADTLVDVEWYRRQRAWGEAFSDRYRFTVDREPGDERPCRYVVRRQPRGGL